MNGNSRSDASPSSRKIPIQKKLQRQDAKDALKSGPKILLTKGGGRLNFKPVFFSFLAKNG